MDKPIVLIGLPGAGKTSVGKKIAKTYQLPFVDTDAVIETQIKMKIGEFFQRFGEAEFRALEKETLLQLMNQHCVMATGGGVVLDAENRQLIHNQSICVYLDANIETIYNRIKRSKTRPLLQVSEPLKTLAALKEQREALYRECAHIVVDANTTNMEQLCQSIYSKLTEKGDRL